MAISQADVKKLWGLSAGRCAHPDCNRDCITFFDQDDPTVIGEMAHVIAKRADGPRGVPGGGDDTYENLILLCPTHHTEIDRAPSGTFSVERLLGWKAAHETRVREALSHLGIKDFAQAVHIILDLLGKNFWLWSEYGPVSKTAADNPLSNAAYLWDLRRLSVIVPNNTRICSLLEQFTTEFSRDERVVINVFREHAVAYERHCYSPLENYPLFPSEFRTMMEARG